MFLLSARVVQNCPGPLAVSLLPSLPPQRASSDPPFGIGWPHQARLGRAVRCCGSQPVSQVSSTSARHRAAALSPHRYPPGVQAPAQDVRRGSRQGEVAGRAGFISGELARRDCDLRSLAPPPHRVVDGPPVLVQGWRLRLLGPWWALPLRLVQGRGYVHDGSSCSGLGSSLLLLGAGLREWPAPGAQTSGQFIQSRFLPCL